MSLNRVARVPDVSHGFILRLFGAGAVAAFAMSAGAQVQFAPPETIFLGATPGGVAMLDVDHDGDMDLALSLSFPPRVRVLLQSAGSFAPGQTLQVGPAPAPGGELAAADVNGDGWTDLVMLRPGTTSLQVIRNQSGVLVPSGALLTGLNASGLSMDDIDGDLDIDLAVASATTSTVTVGMNNGLGAFVSQQLVTTSPPRATALADLDQDGDKDLVVTASAPNVLFVYGRDLIQYQTVPISEILLGSTQPGGIVAAALGGDSATDVAFAAQDGVQGSAGLAIGFAGVLNPPLYLPVATPAAHHIAAVDLDGDGMMDLVVADETSGAVAVLRGSGEQIFDPAIGVVTVATPKQISIGDIDGDGDPDVIIANAGSGSVTILRNFGAPVPAIRLIQYSWVGFEGNVSMPFSDYGEVILNLDAPELAVDFDADPDGILWVNAIVNGVWSLKHAPMIELSLIKAVDRPRQVSFLLPLPTPPGVPLPESTTLTVGVSSDPGAPPAGQAATQGPAQQSPLQTGDGLPGTQEEPMDPVVPPASVTLDSTPPAVSTWESTVKPEIAGVNEGVSECIPAALARSIDWLNHRYCLELPAAADTPQEIHDTLKDPEHMDTNGELGKGTKMWLRVDDFTNDHTHFVYGKMWAGLLKFLEEHGLLAQPRPAVIPEAHFFKSQPLFPGQHPPHDPCDIFDLLKAGSDVTVMVGWWNDENSLDNGDGSKENPGDRSSGHMITIVGAVKCGETVTVYYRDDSHAGDKQGDGKTDDSAKTAVFEPGGASGWSLLGGRWEGYVAIVPSASQAALAAAKAVTIELAPPVTTANDALEKGEEPDPTDLEIAASVATKIHLFVDQLDALIKLKYFECAAAVALMPRINEKAEHIDVLAQLFKAQPTVGLGFQLEITYEALVDQLDDLTKALTECLGEPCGGDVNGDESVDGADLTEILGNWGPCPAPCAADQNGDGIVDGADITIVLGAWGNCD